MSNQCAGTTLKGIRCNVKTHSSYCRFHKNQEPPPIMIPVNLPQITIPKIPIILPPAKPTVIQDLQEDEICCVCTDPVNSKLTPCGHLVHMDCVIKSGKNTCPLCRQKVRMTRQQHRETEDYNLKYQRETRQEMLSNLMDQDPGLALFIRYMAFIINREE